MGADLRAATLAALTLAAMTLTCGGCGGATVGTSRGPRSGEIERVRAAAAAHPDDPAAQRALAEWETLGEGGDPARAGASIARARTLAPEDAALAYLQGLLAEQRGQPSGALEAFLEVLTLARTSADPAASFYAESALAYLRDLRSDAPRFVERLTPALDALVAAPGALGMPVRRQALLWVHELALQRGDHEAAARVATLAGCPTEVRVAGPFGPGVLAPFDATLPAEGRGPLADRYDLGPGRGDTETRTIEAQRCHATLAQGRAAGAGTRVVEASLEAPAAGRYVIALVFRGSAQISIDGRLVARVDRRRSVGGVVSFHAMELTAGPHELEVKIASRNDNPVIGWMVDRASDAYDPERGAVVPAEASTPLERFVFAEIAALRGDAVEARERVRGASDADASTAMLSLAARVAAGDPFVPDTRRADDERRLVALAAARDPEAYHPALRQALLETGAVERLAALRAVAERFTGLASVQLALAAELREAGYPADADRAVERAHAAEPTSCAVTDARFDALAERARVDQAMALVPALLACDATNEIRLDLAVQRGEWDVAASELERLARLITPAHYRVLALRTARAAGHTATERRLVTEQEAEAEPGVNVVGRADRRYAAGDRAAAQRLITEEADREPVHAADLRRLTLALSGADVMEPHRVDGLSAIRRFESSGRRYDGHAAVLVFDYMVTRVYADGSSVDLVHQIRRVQTAEGLERWGELRLPGRVLTVRAVSPDGTAREPDRIADPIDVPPLTIGDYVEYEFVRERGPGWGDVFLSEGWIFQNFTEPFDHSEMAYVAPVSLPLRFDARGPVPPPETSEAGGLRTYRFLMQEQRPLQREPNSLSDPPILPSLRASTGVTWERIYEAVHDGLLDRDPHDPAARRLLEGTILRGVGASAEARVARIHRWVVEEVEEAANSFYGSAPMMIAARRGDRARVLRYLLELAGVPARIAFARALTGEPPSDAVPDTSVYDAILVVTEIDGRPLYLSAQDRGRAHDAFPPSLRGQEAILIAPGAPRLTLPTTQGTAPAQRIEAEIALDAGGAAELQVSVALAGAAAASLRNAIEEIPPADRVRVLAERYVPSIVPGARVDPASLTLTHLDDWEADLEIGFRATSTGLLEGARDGLYLMPLFTSGIERAFAALPTRTTTQAVGEVDSSISLRVRASGGALRAPEPLRLAGPRGASATLDVTREPDGAVRMERRVHVPLAAVVVADYPAFATFCRAISELEARTVVLGR